jgi:hypothetical protein
VTPRTTTTYTDNPADGIYYYVARAFHQNWESVNGNEASATVGVVALDVEKGSFTRQAGTGNQTVTLTDSTLTPKVVLFWGTNKTSEGVTANQTNFYGFMVNATEQRAYGSAMDNGQRDFDTRGNTKAIVIMLDGPTISGEADFISFAAGSFTINWTTNDGTQNIIHYTAIGGAALASVKVDDFSMPIVTGEFSETGVGFQPDIVLFLGDRLGTAYPQTTRNSGLAFGAAVSSTKRWAISMAGKGDKSGSGQNTSQVIQFQTKETTISAQADFVAMEADGFRINVTDAPEQATKIAYLAMAGTNLNVDVGSFDQPTSTGIQEITTGTNTEYAHLMSFNKVASSSATAKATISAGGAHASGDGNEGATHISQNDAKDNYDATVTTKIIQLFNTTDAAPTLQAEADFDSFTATSFKLNWTTVDATAREILYWAVGGAP